MTRARKIPAEDFIRAARVPRSIKSQDFGLWQIRHLPRDTMKRLRPMIAPKFGFPSVTVLRKFSNATMHEELGDVVMDDGLIELRRHLPIWRHGKGRVLITGLGLGCVVRGLLIKPDVDSIDVVEIDRQIIKLIGPTVTHDPRVRIHHGDALTIKWPRGMWWDYAWHDVYCSKNLSLPGIHAKLVTRYWGRCEVQGWWGSGARLARALAPKGRMIAA